MDGAAVTSQAEAYERVARHSPGTPVRYVLEKEGTRREISVATERFEWRDWIFLFGAYLLNSIVYLSCGLIVWVLRPYSMLARGFQRI